MFVQHKIQQHAPKKMTAKLDGLSGCASGMQHKVVPGHLTCHWSAEDDPSPDAHSRHPLQSLKDVNGTSASWIALRESSSPI